MRKHGLLTIFLVVLVILAEGALTACGGGSGQVSNPPKNFSITISPTSASLVTGKTQQFTGTVFVNGVATPANDYSLLVNDVPGGNATVGTIVTSGAQKGLYTAPAAVPNPAAVTVKAVVIADPTATAPATVTILPAQVAPSITTQPTSQTVTAGQTATFTVVATGTSPLTYQWQKNGAAIPGATSSSYTTPATAAADNGSQFAVVVSNVAGSVTSATATLTVNLPPPLTVSLSETTATVPLGGSHSFTATPSDPAAAIAWSLFGPGSLSVASGTLSVYSVPTAVPASFSATITVTVTLGAQTATTTAAITLNYPQAVLNGATPRNIFLVREGFVGITFSGSGIYPGCTYQYDASGTAIVLTPNASFTQFSDTLFFGSTNFDPKSHNVLIDCTANGHGAGKSNALGFSFIGNQNTVALSATQLFSLEQGAGKVHVYDLATMAFVRDINVGSLVYAIAYDNGRLIGTQSNGVVIEDGIGGSITVSLPLAVAAKNNTVCATQDQANNLNCFDPSVFNPTPQSISIGTTPMEVVMTTTASNQLSAVVLNAGDGTLAVAPVPLPAQGTVIPSVRLPGMTIGHGEQTATTGGTQFAMLEYTNQSTPVRIAAVISRSDKLIWFVDVSNPTQSLPIVGPFSLSGDPYRIAVDTANKAFVVALADFTANGSAVTRFVKIDPASGAQTNLNSTVLSILSGFAVNPVGGQLVACSGANCSQTPNN